MKRAFDFVVALIILLLCLPAFTVISVFILATMGTPVLFRQLRPGQSGRLFQVVKFRTMKTAFDAAGYPLPDCDRLTPFGRFLRRTSLDELPEVWNVLKGDMSLVGPRPLLPQYLSRYSSEQARRHDVKPGITGWAQINGRNAISWEEKFRLDVWYVDNQSFWLDVKILAMTVWRLLVPEGVNAKGHATMPEFLGTKEVDTDMGGDEEERVE